MLLYALKKVMISKVIIFLFTRERIRQNFYLYKFYIKIATAPTISFVCEREISTVLPFASIKASL